MARARSRTRGANALKLVDDSNYADIGEVADFAEGLKESHLYCREMGHNWRPYTARKRRPKDGGGFLRTLRCTRCRTEREQEISATGLVETNKYIHPEGYLHKGMGRIVGEGRGVLRLESLKRLTAKTAEKIG